MGMYTELMLRCQLKDVPVEVSDLLQGMSENNEQGVDDQNLPNHEFFKCPRWRAIGWSNSFYFTPLSCFKVERSPIESNVFFVIVACDLKNYDKEIELFLGWISPYHYHRGDKTPIGWKRYEEDEEPTILYAE